ncbi:class I adenylate-forming enzyme family protein [Nocardia sp. NPDC003963]
MNSARTGETDVKSPYSNFGAALLSTQSLRAPDAPALTYRGGQQLTYADLDRRVNKVGNALLASGVVPGDRVATLLDSTLSVAENYLAQMKIGTVLCALNPYWTHDTLAQIVSRIEATAFLYDEKFDGLVGEIRTRLPRIQRWIRVGAGGSNDESIDLAPMVSAASDDEPPLGAGGDDLLALFFTSGTTGLPKAVRYTHASGLAIAQSLWRDVPAWRGAALGTGPIIWGVGFIAVAAPAIAAGMRLVLEDSFAPAHALHTIADEGITHISVTPSFFTELLSTPGQEEADLATLRVAMLGGEPLLPSLQSKITARLPGLALYGYFGQTEAPYSVIGRRDEGDLPEGVVGWSRSDGAVRVVDQDGRSIRNRVGAIQLRGPHVMAGYDGQPEATAEVLHDGWFTGGDVGSIDDDGRLTVLGRRSDAIERAGALIMPAQVEEAAARLAGVGEAGAVGLPGANGEMGILLVISPAAGVELDAGEIGAALRSTLPPAAVPDRVVVAEELPHANDGSGGRGKLLRRVLADRFGGLVAAVDENTEV